MQHQEARSPRTVRNALLRGWLLLLLLSGCGDCSSSSKPPEPESSSDKPAAETKGSPEACKQCEERACHNFARTQVDPMAGCFANSDAAKTKLCAAAIDCAHRTGCAMGPRGPELCYCGGAKVEDCYKGQGVNGPCKAEFEAAATKSDAEWVTTHYSDRELALGNAVVLLYCDVGSCKKECSL